VLYPDPKVRRKGFALSGEIPSPINLPQGCFLFSRCPLAQPRFGEEHPALERVRDGRLVRCHRAQQLQDVPGGEEFSVLETALSPVRRPSDEFTAG
jgi:oligopeptide/dipeptide ABC transporter ATP-binding protein